MSKGAKQSILLLIVLLLVSIGCLGYVLLEKQKVEKARDQLTTDLTQSEDRGKKYLADIQSLKDEIAKREQAAAELNRQVKKAEQQITDLKGQVAEVTDDRDKWKERIENVKKERDEIMVKVQEMTKKQREADEEIASYKEKLASMDGGDDSKEESPTPVNTASVDTSPYTPVVSTTTNETDLASLLQEKASLQVKIENLQQELAKSATEVIDLKQNVSTMQIQIDQMTHEKEEMVRDVKYKADMINNLSLELARTKNDKKFISDNFEKLNQENKDLRVDLKKLVNSKSALEKSIVKMSEDKNNIQRKLEGTEGVIQSKIDEIWDIKNSIDATFKQAKMSTGSNEVELPPIVVNSNGPAINTNPGMVNPGLNGKVVSINPDNNFVIVDLGEKSGVNAGDSLSVYRDSKYIAKLEVIQVRKDISAADIKDQWSKIQVGDVIR